MAASFDINIGMNTREVAQGAARAADAVDDITDSLDDLARTSRTSGDAFDRAGDDLERAMSDAQQEVRDTERAVSDLARETTASGNTAERAFDGVGHAADTTARDIDGAGEKAERSFQDMAREADKARKSVDDIGDTGKAGLGKVTEGAHEVQSEIGSNMAEAFSSFRGDIEDVGQIGQDTLGGLAGTIAGTGPAGIVGALALAAGAAAWGIITQNIQDQQEAAKKLRERLSSAYADAAEAGRDYLDTAAVIAEAHDLMWNPDRADEYKRIQEDSNKLRVDENVLIRANAGDVEAQKIVQREINRLLDDEGSYMDGLRGDTQVLKGSVQGLRDRWRDVTDATEEARKKADRTKKLTSGFLLEAASKAKSATEEVDKLGNKLIVLEDGTEFVIDAKTGQAHRDLDKFAGDADGKIDRLNRKEIALKIGVNDKAVRNWTPPTKYAEVQYKAATTRERQRY